MLLIHPVTPHNQLSRDYREPMPNRHNGHSMRRAFYVFMLLSLGLFTARPRTSSAHPLGFSGFRFLIYQHKAKAVFTLHTRDLNDWFPPAKDADYVNEVCKNLSADRAEFLEVRYDGKLVAASDSRAFLVEDGLIEVELTFPVAAMPAQIELWCKHLVHLPAGHQQLLLVEDMRARPLGLSGTSVYEGALSREDDHVTVDVPPPPPLMNTPTTAAATEPSPTPPAQSTSHPAVLASEASNHAAPMMLITTAGILAALLALMLILWLIPRRRQDA